MRGTYKLVLSGVEARRKLASGADQLAKAVVSTLGPRSRNVALNMAYPAPKILHDGVSIAKDFRLKDPFEDMGAVLLKEAASKTNDLAGDGTTTATLLGNTLIQEGFKLIEGGVVDGVITGKVNPMEMRDELMEYSELILSILSKKAKKLENKKEYQQVAQISSASEEIGKLVADAIERVGKDGVIMVEESAAFDSYLQFQEGMEFSNGYLSPYFMTDSDKEICEYEDGYVLLTDYRIADASFLVPVLDKVMQDGNKPLLIIADDVEGPALAALVATKLHSKIQARAVAVVAPEFAERRKQVLEDIAVLTGGNVISKDLKQKLEDIQLKDLGRLRSIRVSKTHTTIVPQFPDAEEVQERVAAIKTQIDEEVNPLKKQWLQDRLANLSQSVAVINVGGASKNEIDDKKERVIDAVNAAKAALAEGVIPGGGIALYEVAELLGKPIGDERILNLVKQVLTAPFVTLVENAGKDVAKVMDLINVLPNSVKNKGYDLVTKRAGDMYYMGILDPVKVTKLAVRHSFSIAANVLTTETLISDDPEEFKVNTMRLMQ